MKKYIKLIGLTFSGGDLPISDTLRLEMKREQKKLDEQEKMDRDYCDKIRGKK